MRRILLYFSLVVMMITPAGAATSQPTVVVYTAEAVKLAPPPEINFELAEEFLTNTLIPQMPRIGSTVMVSLLSIEIKPNPPLIPRNELFWGSFGAKISVAIIEDYTSNKLCNAKYYSVRDKIINQTALPKVKISILVAFYRKVKEVCSLEEPALSRLMAFEYAVTMKDACVHYSMATCAEAYDMFQFLSTKDNYPSSVTRAAILDGASEIMRLVLDQHKLCGDQSRSTLLALANWILENPLTNDDLRSQAQRAATDVRNTNLCR